MGQLSYDKRVCVQFLNKFKNSADPTWGFCVYGTYSRPQVQRDADGQVDEQADGQEAQEAAGESSTVQI
jgi:hypothetical protein